MVMVRTVVGGVDTHADVHVAAAIDGNGGVSGIEAFPAAGYQDLFRWLTSFGPVCRTLHVGLSASSFRLVVLVPQAGCSRRAWSCCIIPSPSPPLSQQNCPGEGEGVSGQSESSNS